MAYCKDKDALLNIGGLYTIRYSMVDLQAYIMSQNYDRIVEKKFHVYAMT